jgi:hypothetical protein
LAKDALDSGIAKLIRKIHKNKEGKFSEEICGYAKKLRLKWKESHDNDDSVKEIENPKNIKLNME